MFREVAAIGGLAMKLVFFRGVDIQSFPFTSDGAQLAREMGKIGCIGGYTQIEKLLKHAAKVTEQERVQALVFVGDSVEEDFDCISGAAGELGKLGVPAFVFHEKSEPDPMAAKLLGISPARTEQTFREIALRNSGVYEQFDAGATAKLRDLLRGAAVFAAGGVKALANAQTALPAARLLLGKLGNG